MSLRLTAAVAVVVIAIALVAAYVAAQRPAVGTVPAGSTATYQDMVGRDSSAFLNAGVNCDTIANPKCAGDLQALLSTDRQFQNALAAAQTPQQFGVIDAQLRMHLRELETEYSAALNAVIAQNQGQFDSAISDATVYHARWVDLIAHAIVTSFTISKSNYVALTGAVGDILGGCVSCDQLTALGPAACFADQAGLCDSFIRDAAATITDEQAALVQGLAPSSMAANELNLQSDLAVADTAITAMFDARTSGDQRAFNSARDTFRNAMSAVQADVGAISSS